MLIFGQVSCLRDFCYLLETQCSSYHAPHRLKRKVNLQGISCVVKNKEQLLYRWINIVVFSLIRKTSGQNSIKKILHFFLSLHAGLYNLRPTIFSALWRRHGTVTSTMGQVSVPGRHLKNGEHRPGKLYLEDIYNLKKTGQPLATPPLDQVSCQLYLEDICNLKKTGQPLATPPLDQVGVSQLH